MYKNRILEIISKIKLGDDGNIAYGEDEWSFRGFERCFRDLTRVLKVQDKRLRKRRFRYANSRITKRNAKTAQNTDISA